MARPTLTVRALPRPEGSVVSSFPSRLRARSFVAVLVAAGLLELALAAAITVPGASADPGSNNPKVQYRTFSCDNGNTYSAGFVGDSGGNFFLVDSTSVFAFKSLTLYLPSGAVTYNYGIKGFASSSLISCWYTDPAGVFTTFSGWITPRR
jgi:hypothetical protein